MASSVSSERAFSQGGITITKRRNRLKGDIVEALQCVKCAIRHDLIFREPGPSSILGEESEAGSGNENEDEEEWEDVEKEPWDDTLLENDDVDTVFVISDYPNTKYGCEYNCKSSSSTAMIPLPY